MSRPRPLIIFKRSFKYWGYITMAVIVMVNYQTTEVKNGASLQGIP